VDDAEAFGLAAVALLLEQPFDAFDGEAHARSDLPDRQALLVV
jgi:hypothetical protein